MIDRGPTDALVAMMNNASLAQWDWRRTPEQRARIKDMLDGAQATIAALHTEFAVEFETDTNTDAAPDCVEAKENAA